MKPTGYMTQISDNMSSVDRHHKEELVNIKIRTLEDQIVALLNKSDVPIEAKRLIVAEVHGLLTKEADKTIAYEIKKEVTEK